MAKKEQENKIILTEWVYKPNQLISALVYEGMEKDSKFINLSVNKRKIMNVLIQAVHNHFELELNGDLFKVSLKDLRYRTGMENYSPHFSRIGGGADSLPYSVIHLFL